MVSSRLSQSGCPSASRKNARHSQCENAIPFQLQIIGFAFREPNSTKKKKSTMKEFRLEPEGRRNIWFILSIHWMDMRASRISALSLMLMCDSFEANAVAHFSLRRANYSSETFHHGKSLFRERFSSFSPAAQHANADDRLFPPIRFTCACTVRARRSRLTENKRRIFALALWILFCFAWFGVCVDLFILIWSDTLRTALMSLFVCWMCFVFALKFYRALDRRSLCIGVVSPTKYERSVIRSCMWQ